MKRIAPLLVLSLLVLLAATAWAQGPLSPPGAPGQTMKSLAQIEPRTPIESLPYIISTPGSYYLAGNLTGVSGNDGIVIQADNVSLDLMGFTLSGTSGAQSGIRVWGAYAGIAIRNGFIRGWPYSGVDGATANRGVYEKLDVSENGANGLSAGTLAVVRDCTASANVMRGINAGQGSRVESCQALTNAWGIYAADDVEIKGCQAENNGSVGILAENNGQVTGNICKGNGVGLRLTGEKNYIAENTVWGNSQNYDLAQGNQLNILLGEIPETIRWPANVKLAGTLTSTNTNTNGITIVSSDVTIDLDGHSLIGADKEAPTSGIYVPPSDSNGFQNVAVRNGTIRNFYNGIFVYGIQDSRFEYLTLQGNFDKAIRLFGSFQGAPCNGNTIANCTCGSEDDVYLEGDWAPCNGNTIADCVLGGGIYFEGYTNQCNGNTLANCTIKGYGIYMWSSADGNQIANCTVSPTDTAPGIEINGCHGNSVVGCTIWNSYIFGILINHGSSANRIERNHVFGTRVGPVSEGIQCTGDTSNNVIIANTCVGQTYNYEISSTNTYGPIVTTTGELSTSGADANPWANFSR